MKVNGSNNMLRVIEDKNLWFSYFLFSFSRSNGLFAAWTMIFMSFAYLCAGLMVSWRYSKHARFKLREREKVLAIAQSMGQNVMLPQFLSFHLLVPVLLLLLGETPGSMTMNFLSKIIICHSAAAARWEPLSGFFGFPSSSPSCTFLLEPSSVLPWE